MQADRGFGSSQVMWWWWPLLVRACTFSRSMVISRRRQTATNSTAPPPTTPHAQDPPPRAMLSRCHNIAGLAPSTSQVKRPMPSEPRLTSCPAGLLCWSWASTGAGVSALRLAAGGGTLLCGFDDGSLCALRLHDRQPICHFVAAPAPVVSMAVSESVLLVGTSRADLLVYTYPAAATPERNAASADEAGVPGASQATIPVSDSEELARSSRVGVRTVGI